MDSKIKRRAILISAGAILLVVLAVLAGNISELKRYLPDEGKAESGTPSEIDSLAEGKDQERGEKEDSDFAKAGFAGSDPALQVGDDLRAFLRDGTFFDKELSSYEKKLSGVNEKNLSLVTTSVEHDLRVQILDGAGNIVTGVPFVLNLKEQGSYVDQDKDGVIYIGSLSAGEYEVTLAESG